MGAASKKDTLEVIGHVWRKRAEVVRQAGVSGSREIMVDWRVALSEKRLDILLV